MAPRIEFIEEARASTTNYDFPKFKLEQNEKARFAVMESPLFEWTHGLNKPKVVDGKGVVETKQRRDKSEYKAWQEEFVSQPLCLGDASIMEDKGADPDACPLCKLAQEHPDMTKPAFRRYAMHIARYATRGGSFDVLEPFNVKIEVWAFRDKKFNQLLDIKKEWGSIVERDLQAGPCTNKGFQQFDLAVAAKSEYLGDPVRKAYVEEAFAKNQIPDLSIACGSRKEKSWLVEDVAKVMEAWAIVNRSGGDLNPAASTGSLGSGLDALNGSTVAQESFPSSFPAETPAATAAPAAQPAPTPVASEPVRGSMDFSDLVGATNTAPAAAQAPVDDFRPGATAPAAQPARNDAAAALNIPAPGAAAPAAAAPAAGAFDDLLNG